MKENFKSHLALFIVALIYGANYTIAKGVMPTYLQPFGFIVVRVSGAVMLFWITGIFVPEKINRKDIPLLAFCGLFGVAINQLLFFKGLSMTTPINAAIIMVINFLRASDGMNFLSYGFYLALLSSIGLVVVAYLFRTPGESIKSGFDSLKKDIEEKTKQDTPK